MRRTAKSNSREIFDSLWNNDDHSRLAELVGSACVFDDVDVAAHRPAPLLLLDLINVYKAFVPDLRFHIDAVVKERQHVVTYWSAEGRHCGMELSVRPTGRRIRLRGALLMTMTPRGAVERVRGLWDVRGFTQQVGISLRAFQRILVPAEDDVRLRAVYQQPGVPLLFFPTMTLPGWITWKRSFDALRTRRPVINYQMVANRWAFEHKQMPADYTVKTENRSLYRALARSGTEGPYDVVGHSAGGTLALDFALDHPEQVRSLTLIEPGLSWLLAATGAVDRRLQRLIQHRL